MTYYKDLTPCDYFGEKLSSHFLAIGWLDHKHPFSEGSSSRELVEKLATYIQSARAPGVFAGFHRCELCNYDTWATPFSQPKSSDPLVTGQGLGTRNLFIPNGEGQLYVIPSLALHYIIDHGYRPPEEFLSALSSCPHPQSWDYLLNLTDCLPGGYWPWAWCHWLSQEYTLGAFIPDDTLGRLRDLLHYKTANVAAKVLSALFAAKVLFISRTAMTSDCEQIRKLCEATLNDQNNEDLWDLALELRTTLESYEGYDPLYAQVYEKRAIATKINLTRSLTRDRGVLRKP